SLHDVSMAIQRSNQDVGGSVLEVAGHENVVRGRGYIKRTHDLETIPLKVGPGGTPVTIADLGQVVLGPEIRRGVAELNGEGEAVGGVVIMRYGENALDVIDGVQARLDDIRKTLPAGVQIVPTYDRSTLIRAS